MTGNGAAGKDGAGPPASRRRRWVTADEAEAILASARRALIVMTGFLALIWLVQVVNWVDGYRLTLEYGIRPRSIASLPDLLTAPFLHVSWAHIEGNSGPLFIFGFLAAYRGIRKFLSVTAVVILTSGVGAWLTEAPHTVGVGASGVVFGYFGYIMVRGLFDRRLVDIVIGAVMALCFAYQFTVLLPHAGIGWQAHIGGLAGGLLSGWVFRDRRARAGADGVMTGPTAGVMTGPAAGATPKPVKGGAPAKGTAPAKGGTPAKGTAPAKGAAPATGTADLLRKLDEMGI